MCDLLYTKVFAKGTNRRRKPQPDRTGVVSCWLGFIFQKKALTTNPKKTKSRLVQPPCQDQVSESLELTRIVSQFIEANRAPRETEKDF
jgi:putative transposase